MSMHNEEQISLFGDNIELKVEKGNGDTLDEIINVSQMKHLNSSSITWRDLFRGYNDIKVITFSYGMRFIEKVMRLFNTGEIIIGCEALINKEAASILAVQEFSQELFSANKYLKNRVNSGEFRLYVAQDIVSHQKIYLLSAEDGRVRTIFGSANMSEIAWNGEQIENYHYCDDISFYNEYLRKYETLKSFSTSEISKEALAIKISEDGDIEIPIMKQIEKNGYVVINSVSSQDDPEYMWTIEKKTTKWEEYLKEAKIRPDKDGSITIKLKDISKIYENKQLEKRRKEEREKQNPPFVIDYNSNTASFKGKNININPPKSDIKKDIEYLISYMAGFDNGFTGNIIKLKESYWKVLNFMFLSPFLAKLRMAADDYNYDKRFFPIYLLLRGESDAGKTVFVETIQKLMYNETLVKLDRQRFSSKPMAYLKENVKGCTILIDELTPTYWKYAREIVKSDDYLAIEGFYNHPTFVMTSNEIKNISRDLSKRIIYMNFNNRLPKDIAALNDNKIKNLRENMSNAFYGEYLRRAFDIVDKLINDMQQFSSEVKENWVPDIFKLSSKLIMEIISDNGIEIPKELKEFNWFDYMGESVIGEKAINLVRDEYEHNKSIFYVNKRNELEIDFSMYEKNADSKIKLLVDELPAELMCKQVGSKAVMNNAFVKDKIGISIKYKVFQRRK